MNKWPQGKFWDNYDSYQLQELENQIFNDLRSSGFPFSNHDFSVILRDFENLRKSNNSNPLIDKGYIRQTMTGLKAVWPYFKHHIEVRCGNSLTPYEVFQDDDLLRKAIRHRLKHGTYLTESGIRKSIKIVTGCQSVSNFRPSAAKAIYERYGGGKVYDMSAGYGGRLLAAMASDKVESYTGIDVDKRTFDGLCNMKQDFRTYHNTDIQIYSAGAENFYISDRNIDICFTSPPYFDNEKYDSDDSQSYIKFPDKEKWFHGFLMQMVHNCSMSLREHGIMAININNISTFPDLVDRFYAAMQQEPFEYVETLKLCLSNMPSAKSKSGNYKFEPVFVYRLN